MLKTIRERWGTYMKRIQACQRVLSRHTMPVSRVISSAARFTIALRYYFFGFRFRKTSICENRAS